MILYFILAAGMVAFSILAFLGKITPKMVKENASDEKKNFYKLTAGITSLVLALAFLFLSLGEIFDSAYEALSIIGLIIIVLDIACYFVLDYKFKKIESEK